MLLFLLAQLASACPTDPDDLALRATRALEDGDSHAFQLLMVDLQCVTGPFGTAGAVAMHRLAALAAWEARDLPTVAAHLRATPDDDWAPADPSLAKVAKSTRGTESYDTEGIAVPPGWRAIVDGRPVTLRPVDRAAVFQWVDDQGDVRRTVMLSPTDAIPPPPTAVQTDMAPPPKVTPWAGEPKNLVLMAGIGAGVAAGSLVTAGFVTRSGLPDPTGGGPDPALVDSVKARARRANALGYAGQGVGVLAVGLVVTSRIAF